MTTVGVKRRRETEVDPREVEDPPTENEGLAVKERFAVDYATTKRGEVDDQTLREGVVVCAIDCGRAKYS